MSEKPATTKKTNPNIRLTPQAAQLAAFVTHYKAQNDAFEASINALHARWEATGIGQPLPPRRGSAR